MQWLNKDRNSFLNQCLCSWLRHAVIQMPSILFLNHTCQGIVLNCRVQSGSEDVFLACRSKKNSRPTDLKGCLGMGGQVSISAQGKLGDRVQPGTLYQATRDKEEVG